MTGQREWGSLQCRPIPLLHFWLVPNFEHILVLYNSTTSTKKRKKRIGPFYFLSEVLTPYILLISGLPNYTRPRLSFQKSGHLLVRAKGFLLTCGRGGHFVVPWLCKFCWEIKGRLVPGCRSLLVSRCLVITCCTPAPPTP